VPAEAGIRWSTVQLPVVAGSWRVPGCGRWKSLTKGIFVFGTAVVLAAGSLLARSESREKHRAVTELAGVKLGMTPREVVAALGEPTYVDRAHRRATPPGKRKRDDTAFGYVYGRAYDPDYSLQLVFFNGESPRLGIACEVHAESSALGLSKGAKELNACRHSPLLSRMRTLGPLRIAKTLERPRVSPVQRLSALMAGSRKNAEAEDMGRPRSIA